MLFGASRRAKRVGGPGRKHVAALAFTAIVLGSACQMDNLLAYYPLDAGRSWQYRVSVVSKGGVLNDAAVVTNLPEKEVLGRQGIPQRSQVFGKSVLRFLAATDAGIVEFAHQAGETAPVAADPPDYILRAPIAPGTSWRSVWKSTRDAGATPLPTVKTIAGMRETVMVPAGTFADCLRVKVAGKAEVTLPAGRATIEVSGDEWYARDVGFIKGAFRETVNQGEGAVEVAMNLESFSETR